MTEMQGFRRKAVFTGHTGSVYALARGSGNSFFSGGGDRIVAEWNLDAPEEGKMIAQTTGIIYSILRLNRMLLVGQSQGGIHVIDLDKNAEVRLLQYHDSGVFNLHHIPEHDLILSLAGDGSMGMIDAEGLTLINKLSLGTGKLRSAAHDPVAGILAVGAADGSIYTFTLPGMKPVRHWQAHQPGFSVNAVRFSRDGKYLLSGSRDAHLNVFSVEDDFKPVQSIPAHNYAIYSIEFADDLPLFATGSRDKTIKIWDEKNFEVIQRIDKDKTEGHVNSVNKIIWHPSGSILSASDDRSVMCWGIEE